MIGKILGAVFGGVVGVVFGAICALLGVFSALLKDGAEQQGITPEEYVAKIKARRAAKAADKHRGRGEDCLADIFARDLFYEASRESEPQQSEDIPDWLQELVKPTRESLADFVDEGEPAQTHEFEWVRDDPARCDISFSIEEDDGFIGEVGVGPADGGGAELWLFSVAAIKTEQAPVLGEGATELELGNIRVACVPQEYQVDEAGPTRIVGQIIVK